MGRAHECPACDFSGLMDRERADGASPSGFFGSRRVSRHLGRTTEGKYTLSWGHGLPTRASSTRKYDLAAYTPNRCSVVPELNKLDRLLIVFCILLRKLANSHRCQRREPLSLRERKRVTRYKIEYWFHFKIPGHFRTIQLIGKH